MKNTQSRRKIYREVKSALEKELERWEKKYIYTSNEEKEFRINQMVREVEYAKEQGREVNVRQAFRTEVNALSRHTLEGTRRQLFQILKSERHFDYNHLNTYLYRLGYSVAQYWNDPKNSDITTSGSIVSMTLELPKKTKGRVSYDSFVFEFDYSNQEVVTSEFV